MHKFTKLCAFIILSSTLSQQLVFAQYTQYTPEQWEEKQIKEQGDIANPRRPDLKQNSSWTQTDEQKVQEEYRRQAGW